VDKYIRLPKLLGQILMGNAWLERGSHFIEEYATLPPLLAGIPEGKIRISKRIRYQ
jgi:hypothetical protein